MRCGLGAVSHAREGRKLPQRQRKVLRMDGGRTLGASKRWRATTRILLWSTNSRISLRCFSIMRSIHAIVFLILASFPANAFSAAPATIERQPDGIALQLAAGELRIQWFPTLCARRLFQVPRFLSTNFYRPSCASPCCHVLHVKESPAAIVLSTAELRVTVDRETGAVSFADSARASFAVRGAGRQNARIR